MRTSFFIANRLYQGKSNDQRVSRLARNIATLGVSLGLAIMLLSVAIVLGFRKEISNKITGFARHIQVINPAALTSPQDFPFDASDSVRQIIGHVDGVESVQRVSNKAGIIKTDTDFKGILLKGIADEYDVSFLQKHIQEGNIPHFTKDKNRNSILISRTLAKQMNLKTGDKVYAYFFEDALKTRLFTVEGIYETHMSQFDDVAVIANLYTVNQLNNWSDSVASGFELTVKNDKQIEETYLNVLGTTRHMVDKEQNQYATFTIQELYAQIFEWLKLLDLNIWVILILMVCVASFTMISGLLILILEKTNTIGILKSLGSSNHLVRNIFLNYAILLMGRGIIIGNIVGLGLAFIQQKTGIITLNPQNYYVDSVPITFNLPAIILINLGTITVCTLALIGPSFLVSRIRPVKAIRFD
jgi:lipoprotein-releasing system permease protein